MDFANAFNECDRTTFLQCLLLEFPELYCWVHWCYSTPATLHFGHHFIYSSSRVQQGDPLGPLLFSLTLSELLKSIHVPDDVDVSIWYLDDGTIIGPRATVAHILNQMTDLGPQFGLYLNHSKCELFWPSGDATFPEFPPDILRLEDGVSLLGSPLWGSRDFFVSTIAQLVDRVVIIQSKIANLDDPQVALHLLRSCLGIGKINHILRTVPSHTISSQLARFDEHLHLTLSNITHSPISDRAWQQASLPFRLGGLGLKRALPSAHAAFLASCYSSRDLVCQLLSSSLNLNSTP